jgi:selenocysteine-specific elongation factor
VQVIGTAGHVDHGKSALINRLTGINPDRLKQEQEREMSIELGFAWFTLPNGEDVGVVDVPGHRDFIENMLAGIGGIDAVLFVVAADEGVMPQTREHLAILDLLQVLAGVVALTKIDLVQDPDWLDLVEADLRETLTNTVLMDAPIVRVSAHTGAGIDELVKAIQDTLTSHPHRPDLGRPRLPIDRVFTLSGFGTIVTGTLSEGTLSVGSPVEILPAGTEGRIRGLQTHKQAEKKAQPGSRTAVNISGIDVDEIERGDVLVYPGTYPTTKMIDVWCTLLPDAEAPLKHNTQVKFFLGAAEIMARVRVLGTQELSPGEDAFLQLMLREPVVALRGDRFIIRRPSPPATIGGGQVLDSTPKHRHKRFNTLRLEELERLLIGTPEEIVLQTAQKLGATSQAELIKDSGLEDDPAEKACSSLIEKNCLIELDDEELIITADDLTRLTDKIKQELAAFHQKYPLRAGMPREHLKSQLGLNSELFDALINRMVERSVLQTSGAMVKIRDHSIRYTQDQQTNINVLLNQFNAQPYSPPSVKQSIEVVSEEVLKALIETGQLVQLNEDVLLAPEHYHEMRQAVIDHINHRGSITLAELRDKFDTSRKYAVAVLEYMDKTGLTVRHGDKRILNK